ncbi:MAG: DUF885 family protein [Vicinamibacterales bacterium]
MIARAILLIVLAFLAQPIVLGAQANVPSAEAPASELAALVSRYSADRQSLMRRYTVQYLPERAARLERFYKDWQKELSAVKYDGLGAEGRIDYVLLTSRLEYELRLLAREQAWVKDTVTLLPFAKDVTDLLEKRGRLDPMDGEAAAAALDRVSRGLTEAMRAVDRPGAAAAGPVADAERARKINALRAVEVLTSLKDGLAEWHRFYGGYDPMFTWWAEVPYTAVDKGMAAYLKVLKEKVIGYKDGDDEPIVGNPVGRDALVSDLLSEFVPYTPEELLQVAEREFAWCDREMLRASREMGFGDDWKAALEKVKTLHVEPGRQVDLVLQLAREAEDYVEQRDLITIPPLAKEDWRMVMMSPERQKVNPFFLGGEMIQVSYPTDTMDHDDKLMSMRGNNIHFSRSTVFHELNPGHHLQGFMTARYNTQRRAFGTPFWTEGWSLYWEMLLWDDGFPKTPENRIGMLFWRMHRCARIIFSLRFHLGEWSPQECIDFLVDRVGHERANAEAEVRRSFNGTYPPLYQLAYMMGGLQFRALHAELVESGRMTNRQFHDTIMKAGSMPVELVRASLMQTRLPAGFKTNWKFAGALQ